MLPFLAFTGEFFLARSEGSFTASKQVGYNLYTATASEKSWAGSYFEPVTRYDLKKREWVKEQPYELQIRNLAAIYQKHEEALAIDTLSALVELDAAASRLQDALTNNRFLLESRRLTPDDVRRRAACAQAVAIHAEGQHEGLTEVFVEETKDALDRLLVRLKLAAADE